MFIPVVLKAPRYYIYICAEETHRLLSATSIALEDIFRITYTACFGVMYFIYRYLLFYSTLLVLLIGPTGCCKKGKDKVHPIPCHDNTEGE
jgi:hypothetical protein